MPSVIIPAHNEAASIDHLLNALDATAFEIIVVANGCTDDTATRARTHPGVQVIELDTSSKAAALRAGDDTATTFPRAYLDADISITTSSLLAVFRSLETPGVRCAAPTLDLDCTGSSPAVRAALRAWLALPWSTQAPVGSGCYALSEEGHTRVAPFPDLIADDAYVSSSFAPHERRAVRNASFTAHAPRTLRALIARRRRVQRGNRQLTQRDPERAHALARTEPNAVLSVARRRPMLIPGLLILAGVHALADRDPRPDDWGRDETSRATRTSTDHRPRTMLTRLGNLVRSAFDPRLYLHLFRIAHFFGYTHVAERRHVHVGRNVRFSPTASLRNGTRITIGDDSAIGEYSALWAGDSTATITIGQRTLLGPSVFVIASNYGIDADRGYRDQPKQEAPITIGNDVWLGARVIVTAGVTIHDGCVVGAGAVVTHDLPPNTIAVGVPARVIGLRPGATDDRADHQEATWVSTSRS